MLSSIFLSIEYGYNHIVFLSIASANVCNVFLMRNNELTEGIEVLDQNRNPVGTSKIAARKVRVLTLTAKCLLEKLNHFPYTVSSFTDKILNFVITPNRPYMCSNIKSKMESVQSSKLKFF